METIFAGLGPSVGPTTAPDSVDEALAAVAKLGASGTQLFANEWDIVVGGRIRDSRLARYRTAVERYPMGRTLHAPIAELNLFDADLDFQVQQFRAWIQVAAALGCPTMTYHPGRYDPAVQTHAAPEELLLRERDALAGLADDAAAAGVTIACENLHNPPWWPESRDSYSADPIRLVAQLEAIGHPSLGVCLDFGHLYLESVRAGFDFLDGVRRLAPQAVVLHVHDNLGKLVRHPQLATFSSQLILGEGDLHLPLGWGSVPLEPAFASAEFTREPICVLEIQARYWKDDPSVAMESIALGQSLTALAASPRPVLAG